MKKIEHFYFLTWENLAYSRTGVLYTGLLEKGKSCHEIKLRQKKYFTNFKTIYRTKKSLKEDGILIIGSPCSILVIICRLALPFSKILYDAGWPLIDGLMSRKYSLWAKILGFIKLYLIDLLAFHLSDLISIESLSQKSFVKKTFLISSSKIFVSYTGFNEVRHREFENTLTPRAKIDNKIIFRGKYNLEAGLEFLAESSYYLDKNLKLLIICPNLPAGIEFNENTEIVRRRITSGQLIQYYSDCKISLGQLGISRRTRKTIPHKFFESIFFEVPYLTRRSSCISELLPSTKYYTIFENLTPSEFAGLIKSQIENLDDLEMKAKRAKEVYCKNFSQRKIIDNFLLSISKLI